MNATISKTYIDLPFAHRQPNHRGHCALLHGHNWSFAFEFGAHSPDANGFVVDFGDLKWLRQWLEERFDHTLVLNEDDPMLPLLRGHLTDATCDGHGPVDLAKIVTVPNCGAEGLAEYIAKEVSLRLSEMYLSRVYLISVTVHEDSKNTATYHL